jgi:hypothetical protein
VRARARARRVRIGVADQVKKILGTGERHSSVLVLEYDFDIAMAVCLLQSPCFWKNVFRQQFEPFYVVQASPLQHYFIGASSGILPNLLYQFLSGPNEGVE